jgi:hypothetical protein
VHFVTPKLAIFINSHEKQTLKNKEGRREKRRIFYPQVRSGRLQSTDEKITKKLLFWKY